MERLQQLFNRYLENKLSEDEFTEFWQLLNQEADAGKLSPQLQALWETAATHHLPHETWNSKLKALLATQQPTPVSRKISWKRWAAAAAILIIATTGTLFYFNNQLKQTSPVYSNNPLINDVAPGTNGSILHFDNGQTILLDTAHDGQLTSTVSKKDATLTVKGNTVGYATLATPRARQQQLTLADGSKVWLNAASSIRFPSAFKDDKRVVEITGEVYFEIAKDVNHPFIVKVNGAEVEVLGTHFNVMAYGNESSLQTTLLEGAVKFKKEGKELLLKPGQQAILQNNGNLVLQKEADTELIMAWKNGLQAFKKAGLADIMRQVERWYDVEVEYTTRLPTDITFSGEVPRNVNLSELLKVLESREVKFKIDGPGKKIRVTK